MIEISIVIATYNRAELLRACLTALTRQTQPATSFEIVVVIDGSTDDSGEVIASFGQFANLRAHVQPNQGVGTARNKGAELATAPLLLFLDDDILAAPGLVAAHVEAHRAQPGIVGLGRLTDRLSPSADGFTRAVAETVVEHYARLEQGRQPDFMDCYSGNLSVPRDAFVAVGGFAVDLPRSEDVELGYRLHRAGLRFAYIPGADGVQDYGKRFPDIAADIEKAGVAALAIYRRHPAMLSHMHLAEFSTSGVRTRLARRLLLALAPPDGLLRLASRLIDHSGRARSWYRLLNSYFYWRGVRAALPDQELWGRLTDGTRILMYHAVGHAGERAGRYVVPRRRFLRQMRWIERRGYQVLGLEDYLRLRREGGLPPRRSVILTFDDGYADFAREGQPVLRRFGFPATLFVVSGAVGAGNEWDKTGELAGRPTLSWADLDRLQDDGVSYGAHSRSHAALPVIPADRRREEVAGSLADLRRRLAAVLPVFSYPYGLSDESVEAEVAAAGFEAGCGIEPGLNGPCTPALALRRTEVFGTDGPLRFAYALWSGRRP